MSNQGPWKPGNADAHQERLTHIQSGMEVEDASGERIGSVAYVQFGDPGAVEPSRGAGEIPGEEFALAFGAHREPNVPQALAGRLLLSGFIKVDDKLRFRPDHHYYATADEIVSVDGDTVRLNKVRDDLIKSGS